MAARSLRGQAVDLTCICICCRGLSLDLADLLEMLLRTLRLGAMHEIVLEHRPLIGVDRLHGILDFVLLRSSFDLSRVIELISSTNEIFFIVLVRERWVASLLGIDLTLHRLISLSSS